VFQEQNVRFIGMATIENSTVPSLLASKYPVLNSKLPLRVTRMAEN